MTSSLEDTLTTALRERAEAVRPTRDVLGAARRRHRRRTATHRAVSAGGGLGLAAAVTAGVTLTGAPAAQGPHTPPPAASAAPVPIDVRTVSARVAAALGTEDGTIRRLRVRATLGGRTTELVAYDDPAGHAHHSSGAKIPGARDLEYGVARRGDRDVVIQIDRGRRTWWRETWPARDDDADPKAQEYRDLRRWLTEGTWTDAGRERVGGRETLHLIRARQEGGDEQLWADPESYRLVRRVIRLDQPDGPLRIQEDYAWLERTPENLALLRVTPPAAYRQVPPPSETGDGRPKG